MNPSATPATTYSGPITAVAVLTTGSPLRAACTASAIGTNPAMARPGATACRAMSSVPIISGIDISNGELSGGGPSTMLNDAPASAPITAVTAVAIATSIAIEL